jgi:hypothetical protein
LDIEPYTALTFDRHWFPRSHVETALKVALAHKALSFDLDPDAHSTTGHPSTILYPPLPEIIPAAGNVSIIDSLRFDPQYLALLPLVTKACETDHITLTVANRDQPVRFDIKGRAISAVAIISPKSSDFSGE